MVCRSTRSAMTMCVRRCTGCCSGATARNPVAGRPFRAHYGFEAFYCLPGKDGAHEKGRGGRRRRPVPAHSPGAGTAGGVAGRAERSVGGRRRPPRTPAVLTGAPRRWARGVRRGGAACDRPVARAVRHRVVAPVRGWTATPRSWSAKPTTRLPARLIGTRVRVALSASALEVFDGSRRVAAHPRVTTRGGCALELDHYLEILGGKPGALPGSTALAPARASGRLSATHEAFWAAARNKHGDPRRDPGVDRGTAAAPAVRTGGGAGRHSRRSDGGQRIG